MEKIRKIGEKYYYYPERENEDKTIQDYLKEYKMTGNIGLDSITNETMIELIKQ